MGKLGEQRREARIKRIHDAAMALFAEQGYEATTMEQIAERADFSVRTLYNYFASKADILVDSIQTHQAWVHRHLSAKIETMEGPAAGRFAKLFRTAYEELKKDRALMCEVAAAMISPHTRLSERMRPIKAKYAELTEDMLRACVAEGLLPKALDTRQAAGLLMITVTGVDMSYLAGEIRDLDELERTTERIVDAILRGLSDKEQANPVSPRLPGVE